MFRHNTRQQERLFAWRSHHTCDTNRGWEGIRTICQEYKNIFIKRIFVSRRIIPCCGNYKRMRLTNGFYGILHMSMGLSLSNCCAMKLLLCNGTTRDLPCCVTGRARGLPCCATGRNRGLPCCATGRTRGLPCCAMGRLVTCSVVQRLDAFPVVQFS